MSSPRLATNATSVQILLTNCACCEKRARCHKELASAARCPRGLLKSDGLSGATLGVVPWCLECSPSKRRVPSTRLINRWHKLDINTARSKDSVTEPLACTLIASSSETLKMPKEASSSLECDLNAVICASGRSPNQSTSTDIPTLR